MFGVIAEFHRNVIFIHSCFSPVLDIAGRQSLLMLGSSVFTDLKISDESLKSQGNLTSSPVATLLKFDGTLYLGHGPEKSE